MRVDSDNASVFTVSPATFDSVQLRQSIQFKLTCTSRMSGSFHARLFFEQTQTLKYQWFDVTYDASPRSCSGSFSLKADVGGEACQEFTLESGSPDSAD